MQIYKGTIPGNNSSGTGSLFGRNKSLCICVRCNVKLWIRLLLFVIFVSTIKSCIISFWTGTIKNVVTCFFWNTVYITLTGVKLAFCGKSWTCLLFCYITCCQLHFEGVILGIHNAFMALTARTLQSSILNKYTKIKPNLIQISLHIHVSFMHVFAFTLLITIYCLLFEYWKSMHEFSWITGICNTWDMEQSVTLPGRSRSGHLDLDDVTDFFFK